MRLTPPSKYSCYDQSTKDIAERETLYCISVVFWLKHTTDTELKSQHIVWTFLKKPYVYSFIPPLSIPAEMSKNNCINKALSGDLGTDKSIRTFSNDSCFVLGSGFPAKKCCFFCLFFLTRLQKLYSPLLNLCPLGGQQKIVLTLEIFSLLLPRESEALFSTVKQDEKGKEEERKGVKWM